MIPNIAEKIKLFPDWAPIRKLMKDNGAEMVGGGGVVDILKEYLDKMARDIVKKALKISTTLFNSSKKYAVNPCYITYFAT